MGSQTWKYNAEDEEKRKIHPMHVESGVIKFLNAERQIEASFVHPFSVCEVALGTVSEDNKTLVLEASIEKGSFLRGPGAKGKQTEVFTRRYEIDQDWVKMSYECGLKSEAMPELW